MTRTETAVVLTPVLGARGGAERVALVMASTLRDLGYRTHLVGPGNVEDLKGIGQYLDVDVTGLTYAALPVVGTPARWEALRSVVEEVRWSRQIAALRPDVFVNCLYGTATPGPAETNLYYVHFPHDLHVPRSGGLRRAYLRGVDIARWACSRGRDFRDTYSAFLANSAYTARHVEDRWGVEAEVLYPPCVTLGGSDGPRQRRILGVGRFQDRVHGRPHKRQDAMIAAFSTMRELHDDGWELHLAGSVGSQDEVERLTKAASGLPVVFHLDLPRSELVELYRTSAIYWHAQGFEEPLDSEPHAHEHFGITTVEALSAGMVVMVHDSGGPAEIARGVPGAVLWQDLEKLRDATRACVAATDSDVTAWRRAAETRAHDFDEETFRARVTGVLEGRTTADGRQR